MKKRALSMLLASALIISSFAGCSGSGTSSATASSVSGAAAGKASSTAETYATGKLVMYAYGSPKYLAAYYQNWLKKNAPNVTFQMVQTSGAADSREKVTTTYLAGSYDDLPDALMLDPANLMELVKGGMIKDETSYVTPLLDKMVAGAANDAKWQGKICALPDSVRPQELFYNKNIFDKYGIKAEDIKTIEDYVNVGRVLKQKSSGKVYLSYIDPGPNTWRYWGRRGLMPQANAKIWDDQGNIVIGSDKGTKLAFGTLNTMYSEGMLLKSAIMKPALYDSIRKGEVATFYIGAFWDEFMRKNVSDCAGQWRVMPAPVFKDIGTSGAAVSQYLAVMNKQGGKYDKLVERIWHDFTFDGPAKEQWVNDVMKDNGAYSNPISTDLLKSSFWKAPSDFYGGESFREMEGKALNNASANLTITPQDSEADTLISAELEKYVAGSQSMDQAIHNMDTNLKAKVRKAEIQPK